MSAQNSTPNAKGSRRPRAQQLGTLAQKVLEPVIARRAGMNFELMAAWPDVIGPPYGVFTMPEKILWPRRANAEAPFEPATLVVACDGSRAVQFQHELGQCIERINRFFGYEAIARIRIVQKPVAAKRQAKIPAIELPAERRKELDRMLEGIADPALKSRLARLGEGVMKKGLRARQAATGKA